MEEQQPTVDHLRRHLAEYSPQLAGGGQCSAAVALVLRQGAEGVEVLFIHRARNAADPWSGNIAFPGGRIEADDDDAMMAAMRETAEEVGIVLERDQLLGRLDDQHGVRINVWVSCYVFVSTATVGATAADEVQHAFWYPLEQLLSSERHGRFAVDWHGEQSLVPAIKLHDDLPVLWGLTYRFISNFFAASAILPATLAACTFK